LPTESKLKDEQLFVIFYDGKNVFNKSHLDARCLIALSEMSIER
jgi:hypothetical protein